VEYSNDSGVNDGGVDDGGVDEDREKARVEE
jgi:hypothetical protein